LVVVVVEGTLIYLICRFVSPAKSDMPDNQMSARIIDWQYYFGGGIPGLNCDS